MYCMKNIDGKVSNMAKGVNIATEFNEFKETLFNKKVVKHKMKRIQSKKHKIGIYTLAYFRKDLRKQIYTDDHKQEKIQTDKKNLKRFS